MPSIIREGSATPSITLETNECNGLIVVTALMSAFAEKLKKRGANPKDIAF